MQDSDLPLGAARHTGIGHAGQMTVARAEQLIAAQLSVRDGRAAIAFYKSAFGATEDHKVGGTEHDPSVVAQLSVGGTSFWVADESPEHENFTPESLGGSTVRLLLIAEDPQATIDRAVAAGAVEIYAAVDQHGWCLGRVRDPFGHHWEIGKPLGPWPPTPRESV